MSRLRYRRDLSDRHEPSQAVGITSIPGQYRMSCTRICNPSWRQLGQAYFFAGGHAEPVQPTASETDVTFSDRHVEAHCLACAMTKQMHERTCTPESQSECRYNLYSVPI